MDNEAQAGREHYDESRDAVSRSVDVLSRGTKRRRRDIRLRIVCEGQVGGRNIEAEADQMAETDDSSHSSEWF
jgi:hypothetical protein